jgi:hypothetical protein
MSKAPVNREGAVSARKSHDLHEDLIKALFAQFCESIVQTVCSSLAAAYLSIQAWLSPPPQGSKSPLALVAKFFT